MNNVSNSKLYNLIEDDEKKKSISSCVSFVEKIWREDRLIRNYTDHKLEHSFRILDILEKIPDIIRSEFLQEDEIYALLVGVFLHDIGMQCDIRIHKKVKECAESNYDAKFNEKYEHKDLSKKQQNELRENHHLLTAAWIDVAYNQEKGSELGLVVKDIPQTMIQDIIDICKFHSKIDISKCEEKFKNDTGLNKRFIAAILRLGDELDIDEKRVTITSAENFWMPEENSIHWYLHKNTVVNILRDSDKVIINLYVNLCKKDFVKYGKFIKEEYEAILQKNRPLLYIIKNKVALDFGNGDTCREYHFAKPIPKEIIEKYINSKKKVPVPLR